jgi:ADP-ribose pyrophosphatase YjhB (NUDIX family)
MAWIEDAEQKVLFVRQAVGLRLWTLPAKRGESLVKALRRELYEETGLRAQIGSLLGVLDRRDKDAITLLFVEGRSACGAQSRHVQWRHHRVAGGIFLRS